MHKLLLLILITSFSLLNAKMVDGIALIVEGEAVTTAEIRAIRSQVGISKKEAIDLLIQDRLQKSAMRDIKVAETLVDTKVAQIAKQNNLSIPKMQKVLKRQGMTWARYRTSIRDAIKQEKFYKEVVSANIPSPSENELKILYHDNKKSFVMPTYIHVTEYSATTEATLSNFLKTKKLKNIKSKKQKKTSKDLDPEILNTFLQTPNGSYTNVLNAGDKYITYKVHSKTGKTYLSFEAARRAVESKWRQEQHSKTLKDYFGKLRTKANIQILR
jgi:parvulin-like peptidyl-prolyl isomerase